MLPMYGITTPRRIAMFLANVYAETGGMRTLEENMNYSAKRICQVWPTRFRDIAAARPYANRPMALANKVYDRYGNKGNQGWGWKYRGRGFMQTTFVDNYRTVERLTGLDVVRRPNLLSQPREGLLAACIYWHRNGCNELADKGDLRKCRKVINGGYHGMAAVRRAYKRILPLVKHLDLKKDMARRVGAGTGLSIVGVSTLESWWMVAFIVVVLGLTAYTVYKRFRWRNKDVEAALREIEGMEDVHPEHGLDTGSHGDVGSS